MNTRWVRHPEGEHLLNAVEYSAPFCVEDEMFQEEQFGMFLHWDSLTRRADLDPAIENSCFNFFDVCIQIYNAQFPEPPSP